MSLHTTEEVQAKVILHLIEEADHLRRLLRDHELAERARPTAAAHDLANKYGAKLGDNVWQFIVDLLHKKIDALHQANAKIAQLESDRPGFGDMGG